MCICKCLTLKILQFGADNGLLIYKNNSIYTLSENKKYYEKNEKLNIDYNEVIGHDYAFYLINDGSIFNTKERKILSVDSNYSVIERPNVDGFCTSRPGYYRTSNSIYNIITNKYVNTTELETIGDNCIDFMTPNSTSSSFYLTKEHGICTSPKSNTLRYLENSINTPFGKYYAFYVEGEGKGICYNDENNNVLMVFKNDSINKPSINGIKIYETKANIVTQGEIIAPHFNEHCFYCDEIQTNNLYPRKICIDYKIYEYSKEYDDLLQCSPVNSTATCLYLALSSSASMHSSTTSYKSSLSNADSFSVLSSSDKRIISFIKDNRRFAFFLISFTKCACFSSSTMPASISSA